MCLIMLVLIIQMDIVSCRVHRAGIRYFLGGELPVGEPR